jgi:hypothetical protein
MEETGCKAFAARAAEKALIRGKEAVRNADETTRLNKE